MIPKSLLSVRSPGELTVMEIIRNAYVNGAVDALSDTLKGELNRWDFANDLIRQGRLKHKEIATFIQNKFSVSYSTALNDIRDAKQFFGSINREDTEYKRGLYVDWLEEIAKICRQNKDYKNAILAIREASEILGHKNVQPEAIDYSKVQPHTILIAYNPDLLNVPRIENLDKVVAAFLSKKKAKTLDIEDIEPLEN